MPGADFEGIPEWWPPLLLRPKKLLDMPLAESALTAVRRAGRLVLFQAGPWAII